MRALLLASVRLSTMLETEVGRTPIRSNVAADRLDTHLEIWFAGCRGEGMSDEEEDPKTITRKPKVIEHIFEKRYDPRTGEISDPIVKSDALLEAIEDCNKLPGKTLSTKNPANFL
jgi:hypothetical protein